MTVSSSTSAQTFNCDGTTTVFTCPFRVLESSELVGYLITVATNASVPLVNGTDFAVTGVGAANAIATTTTTYSSAYQVNFRRRTQRLQLTDYRDNDPFPAESHENALDRLTHVVQELDTDLGRALLAPEPETGITLPSAEDRADRLLGFDSDGDPVALAPADGSAASLALDLASTTVSTKGAGQIGFQGDLAYPSGTIGAELRQARYAVTWEGADPTGTLDSAQAFRDAIAVCQATLRNLYVPPGTYKIGSTIALTGSPVTIVGENLAPHQQGSTRPSVTLRWTGGATPMFTAEGADWGFVGMAVENFGSATDFLYATNVQRLQVERMSFVIGSGASIFSASIFRSLGNNFGYSRFNNCFVQGASPYFIYIDGNASANGLTPIEISRCLFESNSTGDLCVFYMKDELLDLLLIHGNTFNQQLNELTIVDTTASVAAPVISVFVFRDNEIDSATSATADRMFKLTYCENVIFNNNQIQGGGGATAIGELVGSRITSCAGNQASSIGGPIFSCDSNSRVYPGINYLTSSNTSGIATNPGTGKAGGVLQTVTAAFSTPTTNGTTTLADTGLTASITPTCESSKIKVTVFMNGLSVFAATTAISLKLLRGSTQLIEFGGRAGYAGAVTTELAVGGCGTVYMDEPGVVTATTYKVQFARTGGSGNVGIAQGSAVCTICLEELGA